MTNEEKFARNCVSCEGSEKCSSVIEGAGEEGDAGAALAGGGGSPRPRRSRMTKPCSSSLLMSSPGAARAATGTLPQASWLRNLHGPV